MAGEGEEIIVEERKTGMRATFSVLDSTLRSVPLRKSALMICVLTFSFSTDAAAQLSPKIDQRSLHPRGTGNLCCPWGWVPG
jgi:hypothetical protein